MKNRVLVEDPKGKFLKIYMDFDDVINEIVITGDFFAHPEEAIDELQDNLKGARTEPDVIKKILEDFFELRGVRMYGISLEGLLMGIMECLEGGTND
ncbi:MAG: lipoate--protein ligase family protein [Thermoplasmata archaeon]|nr:lipoate--protein ligase family protein [Thermoplasmata archaeon]